MLTQIIRYPFLIAILITGLFIRCNNAERQNNRSEKVYIAENNGKYTLFRDGKPFAVKGAGGYTHLKQLKEAGGNTIRTWDTTHLSTVLDSARANGIAVIAGLPLPNSSDMSFYDDPVIVKTRYNRFRSLVNAHKNDPALLMWCLGNELDFPYKWSYNHFYNAFNDLTDMIHREDPDHPITTTVLNFNPKYIFNIRLRCDIDVISFNIFGSIGSLRKDLARLSWFWKDPYMLLEWGINGPWKGTEQTAWGAYIEDTSKKKAEIYKERYQQDMPREDPRYLGSCVFFWGQKQETTQTWFSIFDESGAASETVGVMQYLWTGKPSEMHYPEIRYILLNQKGARDNIMLNPESPASAEVLMLDEKDSVKSIQWEIVREDWYRKNNINSTKKLLPLQRMVNPGQDLKLKFTCPKEEGPYRLFATIYDHAGNFASCNTPFYVVSDR